MKNQLYHGMTGESLGVIQQEMMKKAMREIKNQLGKFTTYEKQNDYKDEDLVTTADYEAQKIYATMIQQMTPNAGIVAEENELHVEPQNGEQMIYTIDPVDGTKALVRKQSDGIGTLLGVVDQTQKEIIAAYVGDVMTGEMYYYAPGGSQVHRADINNPHIHSVLQYQERKKKRLLLLDDIRQFPKWGDEISLSGKYWDSLGVSNGSIGTNMARLWKGEVDAVLLKSGREQPWDRVPCAGISNKMGYVDVQIQDDTVTVLDMNDSWSLKPIQVPYQLIVHREELAEVLQLLSTSGLTIKK